MDYEKQIDRIRECAGLVMPGVLTVLTGSNGSGKSLLRKIVAGKLSEKLGTEPERTVASVSMESRTNRKTDFSALNSLGIDSPDGPTSAASLYNIDALVNSVSIDRARYLVIDEPEIGMGEEMVAALCIKLNEMFSVLPEGCLGVLIITHNRYLVENLIGDFLNLDGYTREGWLSRKIYPTDLAKFTRDSNGLYDAIEAVINERKNK